MKMHVRFTKSTRQRLAILLASVVVALCAGCATGSRGGVADRAIADGQAFNMLPGERITLSDASHLRYVEVIADSRCPVDVQCVWAGDAEVAFARTMGSMPEQSFTLHTGRGARSQDFDGRRLTLISLARGAIPQAALRFETAPANAP